MSESVFSGTRALTAGYRFLRWALITVEGTVAAAGRSGLGLIFLLGDTICFARLRRGTVNGTLIYYYNRIRQHLRETRRQGATSTALSWDEFELCVIRIVSKWRPRSARTIDTLCHGFYMIPLLFDSWFRLLVKPSSLVLSLLYLHGRRYCKKQSTYFKPGLRGNNGDLDKTSIT